MADTDREILKKQQAAALGTTGASSPIAEVGYAHTRCYTFECAAGAEYAEAAQVMLRRGKVVAVRVTPITTLAVHAANYITGTVAYRDGDGGSATTIGTFTTNSSGGAALTQFTPTTVSMTPVQLSAGNVITFKTVDAATTTEPGMIVQVYVEEN
jgi:hypothetical protein